MHPHRRIAYGLGLAAIALCTNAAAQSRSQLGSTFEIQYGVVELVEVGRVEPTAAAGRGAAVGGALGLAAASHDHDVRGAVGGAVAGALISSLIAKHQKATAPNAYTYTVALHDGGETKIITDHGDIRQGDCVTLEFGETNNIRRVSPAYCDEGHREVLAHAEVHAAAHDEAMECHAAKESALAARTEAEMDLAIKKVRILCEG